MANGTEDHVGFLAPQSKHIYEVLISRRQERVDMADLVRWFCPQFCEDLLRLRFSRKSHVEDLTTYGVICKFGKRARDWQNVFELGILAKEDSKGKVAWREVRESVLLGRPTQISNPTLQHLIESVHALMPDLCVLGSSELHLEFHETASHDFLSSTN